MNYKVYPIRCQWVNLSNKLSINYHDYEWGVPVYDDNKLFEMLILEGAQAGLSWETILNKRQNYRVSFDNFDVKKVSSYDDNKRNELLKNKGIVRNRLKINSSIQNANIFIKIQNSYGSFSNYIWSFTNHKQITNNFKLLLDIPTSTNLSDAISKDLRGRGMNFVGSTIIYAFMQAIGMVNDHTNSCFRYTEIKKYL